MHDVHTGNTRGVGGVLDIERKEGVQGGVHTIEDDIGTIGKHLQ